MKMHWSLGSRCALALAVTVLGWTAPATAATHWVAVNGVDGAVCGSQQAPCRSISQAMANATAGDTINVGPGHYGDVNGDGNFTGPGDEQPDPNAGSGELPSSVPAGCVVCITKALHIYSLQGAATTVISSVSGAPYGSTVMIEIDGVDFGAPGRGFTIDGGSNNGVTIVMTGLGTHFPFPVLLNMSVQGNIDLGDKNGFAFYGYPNDLRGVPCGQEADCRFTAQVLVAGNQAINNQTGIKIMPNYCCGTGGGKIIVKDNIALGAGTGFAVIPGALAFGASNVQLLNNVASGGGVGFSAGVSGDIKYNSALSNSNAGFQLTPGGAAFFNNSAIGNAGPGVIIDYVVIQQPEFIPNVTLNTFTPFANNNFAGNDRARPALSLGPYQINPGPSAHCGVLSGIFLPPGFPLNPPAPVIQLAAAGNYWGSATGPSPPGPGDAVGGNCAQNNTTTNATPFSKTPFSVGLQIPANLQVLYCSRGSNVYGVGPASNSISSNVSPNASGSPSICAVPATEPGSWYVRTTTDGGNTWHWIYTLSQLALGQ
jgi:hypothetical protein